MRGSVKGVQLPAEKLQVNDQLSSTPLVLLTVREMRNGFFELPSKSGMTTSPVWRVEVPCCRSVQEMILMAIEGARSGRCMANTIGISPAGAHVPRRGKIRSISNVPDELAAIIVGAIKAKMRVRMSTETTIFARIKGATETIVCSPQSAMVEKRRQDGQGNAKWCNRKRQKTRLRQK